VTAVAFTPEEKEIDIATLVTQVRELNRLETASMRVMHIGTIRQEYKLVPNALAATRSRSRDRRRLAGIDLSQLKQEDVWRSPDGMINLRLPPPQILVTRVDNEQSRVLTRKTGVLRRADVDLETRARQHAEANIRAEALKRGVLRMASNNGEKKMAELLRTLGFMRIRFVTTQVPRPEL
jgi:hypothetical protein